MSNLSVEKYGEFLHRDCLIETGTGPGNGLLQCHKFFTRCHSIEIDQRMHAVAQEQLRDCRNVFLYLGDSRELLPKIIVPEIPTTFWLDSHRATFKGDKAKHDCPVVDELRIIFNFAWATKPVMLIDDARFFGDKFWHRDIATKFDRAYWPKQQEIVELCAKHGYQCSLWRKRNVLAISAR